MDGSSGLGDKPEKSAEASAPEESAEEVEEADAEESAPAPAAGEFHPGSANAGCMQDVAVVLALFLTTAVAAFGIAIAVA